MKKTNKSQWRSLLTAFTAVFLVALIQNIDGQSPMPDALLNNPITEQIKFIQERTKIFDNYRAIREDMFQKLMGNISDTLTLAFNRINTLNSTVGELRHNVDTLSASLSATKTNLETAIRTKDSFTFLGREVNKVTYNSIIWVTIAALIFLLALGFLTFKRNLMVTHHTEKELKDLKEEFQTYRKTAREAREKMSMDHFNEIKKLRGG